MCTARNPLNRTSRFGHFGLIWGVQKSAYFGTFGHPLQKFGPRGGVQMQVPPAFVVVFGPIWGGPRNHFWSGPGPPGHGPIQIPLILPRVLARMAKWTKSGPKQGSRPGRSDTWPGGPNGPLGQMCPRRALVVVVVLYLGLYKGSTGCLGHMELLGYI